MNLDELFDQASRVAEPGLPGDVLGGVRRAKARRRRRQLLAVPVTCVVIAVGVLVPTVLSQRNGTGPGPTTTPTTAPPTTAPAAPAPTVMVGIEGDHAVRVDLSTRARTDLGKAVAVTMHAGTPWLARPKAPCETTVVTPVGSFDAHGDVRALEVAPDGRTVAFVREIGPPPSDYYDNLRCGAAYLVLRDVATGAERTWAADDSTLDRLSWSADSRQLAFSLNACCGDNDPRVRVLDSSTQAGDVGAIPELPLSAGGCMPHQPVFAGDTLLVVVECYADSGSTFELRDATTDASIMGLSADTSYLSADASGEHLLLHTFTRPSSALYAINLREHSTRLLSQVVSSPHW